MKKEGVPIGTTRIGKNLNIYEKTKTKWEKSSKEFPELQQAINLFKSHNRFNELIDQKSPKFLKGQLSPEGKVQGARISILPDGKKLDKAFSLFAPKLSFHDESSHDHWDVIYQNPNGKFAYCYTIDKKEKATKNKYKKVFKFEKVYPNLRNNVIKSLADKSDIYALPMYTLLKTYMRVGNEMYYKVSGHKGLTTLTKKDIKISKNNTTFSYIAKSGVPMIISEEFPEEYIKKLKTILSKKKPSDFIFTNEAGTPLKDTDFMHAFEKYCGERFYPHIVRSFYATEEAKKFLSQHKKATKQEVKELFTKIADKLGHKRFDKKHNEWKDSYAVTIHHYIQPELVEKIENLFR